LVSFWHGANWTFIAWGFINALYFFAVVTLNKNRSNMETVSLWDLSSVECF
jgi:D-alanyl-lipoteichoic acid acyltransferase DltB (MBOAT superfamily)